MYLQKENSGFHVDLLKMKNPFLPVKCLYSSYLCVTYSTLLSEFAVPKPKIGITLITFTKWSSLPSDVEITSTYGSTSFLCKNVKSDSL